MKTYEYKRVSAPAGLYGPHIDWLNGKGAKGWRLVAQEYKPMSGWVGLFVREVEATIPEPAPVTETVENLDYLR